jgi:glycosyltransferase involved in cell wall biosynthesis
MVDYDLDPAKNSIQRIRKACHKLLMRHWMDGWVAVSYDVARHFENHFSLPGVTVMYNAFPLNRLRPVEDFDALAVRARYRLSLEDFLLIMPARFTAQKGHRFLLEALGILREKGLYPKVLMIGLGPLMKDITDQAAEMGLQEQVIIRPTVPHDELMSLIQAADGLVLPSVYEGFGLAAGEGMALERPVIVSRVGGLKELVEDGVSGLHVPPGDPLALAEAIARIMREPELRVRLGRAGRERVLTKFNIDVIAEQWEKFFEDLLQRN